MVQVPLHPSPGEVLPSTQASTPACTKPSPQAAFSLALNVENSLLIKRVFDRFQSGDRELSNLLQSLREKKVEHRKRLEVQTAPFTPARASS